jgi:hypothetical protein
MVVSALYPMYWSSSILEKFDRAKNYPPFVETKFYYCVLNSQPLSTPSSSEPDESKYYPLLKFFLFHDRIRGLVNDLPSLRLVFFPDHCMWDEFWTN